jgi:pimeloyl-ACP methyl ester carboxylesterase
MRQAEFKHRPAKGALIVSELFVDSWGSGVPAVLVHGSLATGSDEWQAQRPLADKDFRLLVPDRRGYGRSPAAQGEDFLVDADDIAELMGDGAHLVGHSYGGLAVLFAAARRSNATLSLTLLEPAVFALGQDHQAARTLVTEVRSLWDQQVPDEEWVFRFLQAVGSAPDALSHELLAAAVALVPVFRRGRPMWEPELPLTALASAAFPKLVVSGGIVPDSMLCATTWQNGLARLGWRSRVPVTRFSLPEGRSMTRY